MFFSSRVPCELSYQRESLCAVAAPFFLSKRSELGGGNFAKKTPNALLVDPSTKGSRGALQTNRM